jgi:hypothetical protein
VRLCKKATSIVLVLRVDIGIREDKQNTRKPFQLVGRLLIDLAPETKVSLAGDVVDLLLRLLLTAANTTT